MIKETIKEDKGIFTLYRNDAPAVCPYRGPIVLPGQLQGQVQIIPHTCNSQCPHFVIRESISLTSAEKKITVEQKCGK
jgi:hypothetical protein